MPGAYDENQAQTLYYIGIPFAIISMIGSLLVFGLFYKMYGAHNPSNIVKRFSAIKPIHEFVLLIAVSNLIGAIGNILGIGYPYQTNLSLCKSRQILAIFGGVSSFLLSWIMSFIMYMTIFYPKNKIYLNLLIEIRWRRVIECIIFLITLIISFAPYNLYCSVHAHNNRLIFYIPMFITLIFISFCYLSIIWYFCKQKQTISVDENDMRIYKNIRLYPGIMLFCLGSGLIRRLYNIGTDGNEPPFGFAVLQIITMYSYGAIISGVYIYNVKVNNKQQTNQNDQAEYDTVVMDVTNTETNQ
eukprot:339671_1